MLKPDKHKTIQARSLQYAQDICGRIVFRAEAE